MSNNAPWQGRVDAEDGAEGIRWHQVVSMTPASTAQQALALVGYACDSGIAKNKGRVGALQGPESLRRGLASLPWNWSIGLNDLGDQNDTHEVIQNQAEYADKIANALATHSLVFGLGGGHDIAYGSFSGLRQYLDGIEPNASIGVINIDAHLDLRRFEEGASSGTPFRQIEQYCRSNGHAFHYACLGVSRAANTQALFNFAEQSNTRIVLDCDFTLQDCIAAVTPLLSKVDYLYLTVCLDAFPASIAPGVSAPSALGIEAKPTIELLRWLAAQQQSLNYQWRLFDIAELNPQYDIDQHTAKLAARLAFEVTDALVSETTE